MADDPRWTRDFSLWWAMLVGAFLRVLPLAMWQSDPCVRDECTYMHLAKNMVKGQGMTASERGWLWAPGYPTLMAGHAKLTGFAESIVGTQILLFSAAILFGYLLARELAGPKAGRWAAWLLACSPTLVFFSGHLWSESIYTTLLLGALWTLGWARKGGIARALLPGVLVGACVLFRGVATYMLPLFALGLLWARHKEPKAWLGAGALVLGAAAVVAPYAAYASARFGGLILSDATLGQMMWLGNNDFAPVTFDYGVGPLHVTQYDAHTAAGRPHCDLELGVKAWDACETANGKAWIAANPGEFIRRIPLRWAQLFNPNSFVTRHIRQGRWDLPAWIGEPILWATWLWSFAAVLGGIVGAFGKARSWRLWVPLLIVGYHVAAIGLVAGLSRYRVPLDALFLVFTAALAADPKGTLQSLGATRWRLVAATLLLLICTPLMTWFLLPGYLPK